MLKAVILSLLISSSAFAQLAPPAASNGQINVNKEYAAYHDVVRSLIEVRPEIVAMITRIGLRSDRELAIALFKESTTLLKSLNKVPTQRDLVKMDRIISNYDKISALYELHKGKRYVEI